MLADAIYDVLPKENCDFYGNVKTQIPQSEMLYIGFWTDKGTADCDTLKLLQSLKKYFCLVQQDLAEAMSISKKF